MLAAPRRPLAIAPARAHEIAQDFEARRGKVSAGERVGFARASLRGFVYAAGRDVLGRPLHRSGVTDLLADSLQHALQENQSLSVVAVPGLGKSTAVRLALLWELGNDPQTCMVVTGADKSVSRHTVSLLRAEVASGAAFRAIFPGVRPDYEREAGETAKHLRGWTLEYFFLRRAEGAFSADPTLCAMAARPQAETLRIKRLVLDDFMTEAVAESGQLRESYKGHFAGTWRGRLANARAQGQDGIFLAFQNCWHQEDLGHALLEDPTTTSLWLGVSEDNSRIRARLANAPESHPLRACPELYAATPIAEAGARAGLASEQVFDMPLPPGWARDWLDRKESAGPAAFSRTWRLIAPGSASLMFKGWRAAYRKAHVADLLRGGVSREPVAGLARLSPDFRGDFAIGVGYDIAGKTRPGDSLTVLAAPWDTQVAAVVETRKGNWSVAEVADLLDDFCERGWTPNLIFVENNATQSKIVGALEHHSIGRRWANRVVGFLTGRNKMDPIAGLPGMALDIQRELLLWPAEMKRCPGAVGESFRKLEGSLDRCPRVFSGVSTPDDLMSLWLAWNALRRVLQVRAEQGSRRRTFTPSRLGAGRGPARLEMARNGRTRNKV